LAVLQNPLRPGLSDFVPNESFGVRFLVRYDPLLRKCRAELAKKNFETLLDDGRLVALLQLVKHCATNYSGHIIELGVYKGGSAGATAWSLRQAGIERRIHLCDTFTGMPKTLDWEIHEENDFADTSLLAVRQRLEKLVPHYPIEFHQGLFSDTLPTLSEKQFCFAHIDADLYESVKQACEFVYPRMVKGGVILFDDYGAATCPGAQKAIDEFFESKVEKPSHVALTSYGIAVGESDTDFSKLLLLSGKWRALTRASYRFPIRAIGLPVARLGDSLASPASSRLLSHFWGSQIKKPSALGAELREAHTIIVIRPDGVGDLILMSSFLRELRKSKNDAHIILAVDERFANIVDRCPWIDELLTLKAVPIGPGQRIRQYGQALRFAQANLKHKQIDLALLPRWDVDYHQTAAIAYFSGARNRIGYSETVHSGKKEFNRGMDRLFSRALTSREMGHEVEQNLDFLRQIGGTISDPSLELWLDESDRNVARQALQAGGWCSSRPTIALAPGAGHPKRQWPLGRFIELGKRFLRAGDYTIVIVGGAEDIERAARLAESLGESAVNVSGKMSLRETAAVLELSSLAIANDSGPMHMAAAARAPVVEISCHPSNGNPVHANSPQRFHPWTDIYEVVQPAQAREPCSEACEWHDAHCILDVSIDMVLSAVIKLQNAMHARASAIMREFSRG
jgi:heptosyltransferase-2